MIGVEKKIFRLSSSVLNRTFIKQEKSIFCSMVLRLIQKTMQTIIAIR